MSVAACHTSPWALLTVGSKRGVSATTEAVAVPLSAGVVNGPTWLGAMYQ